MRVRWANKRRIFATIAGLMPTVSVLVKFEERGSTHEVEVLAESTYEAALLAVKAFGKNRFLRGPGRDAVLELTVKSPRSYKIKVGEALDWLYRKPGKTADENARKKELMAVLAEERR